MSTDRKASIAKRQREMEQKDRAKERELRRTDRRARAEARSATGAIGPEIAAPIDPHAPLPGTAGDDAASVDAAAPSTDE